jgi:hypothetical protein
MLLKSVIPNKIKIKTPLAGIYPRNKHVSNNNFYCQFIILLDISKMLAEVGTKILASQRATTVLFTSQRFATRQEFCIISQNKDNFVY